MYDRNYFLNKFSSLGDEEVGSGTIKDHCTLWHCGVTSDEKGFYTTTPEANALMKLFGAYLENENDPSNNDYSKVYGINDDAKLHNISPRQAILDKLNSL